MSYSIVPDSWWWGNRGWWVDRVPYEGGPPQARSEAMQTRTTENRFWKQMRLILIGFVAVAVGTGSLSLYRYNSDLFLIASTLFTILYTLLALYMSMRVQDEYSNDRTWGRIVETLSYIQIFNTFFVMLCVVEITFKTRSRPSGRPNGFNNGNWNNNNNGRGPN